MDNTRQSTRQWDEYKNVIYHLYVVQDLPLKQVMSEMTSRYQFNASKSQYETQLKKKWGFRKYLKAKNEDVRAIARQFALAKKRADQTGDKFFLFYHGASMRPISARTLKKRGALTALLEKHPEVYAQGETDDFVSIINLLMANYSSGNLENGQEETSMQVPGPPMVAAAAAIITTPASTSITPAGQVSSSVTKATTSAPAAAPCASLGSGLNSNCSAPPLRMAVEQNVQYYYVQALLDCGANDVREQANAMTLVEISAKNRNYPVTRLLLSHNFAPDSRIGAHRTTALQYAVINGDMVIMRLLLNYGADPNLWSTEDLRTPLEIAVELQRLDIVERLLTYGAAIDGRSTMISGSDNDTCLTPLQIATKAGSLIFVNILLEKGANLNKRRSPIWYKGLESTIDAFLSPLQLAITWNRLDVLEALLAHGADVNDRASMRTFFHSNVSLLEARQTPLQLAVSKNHPEAVGLLLDYYADVNAPAHPRGGATALQYAAMVGSVSIARALISRGADVNAPAAARDGRTALEGAAEHGHLDMVEFLLGCGVIVYKLDGVKAVMRARNNGHTKVVDLLRLKLPTRHWRSMYVSS